jgi:cytochrome c oxidase accessory protein FixG
MPFWPQDLNLFALLMLTFIFFIIVFTVLFGRVWCGWACPQTIFMEMLFRKIEYLIEGDFNQQKKLTAQPWNTEKILRKGGKHIAFFLVSFFIANTFLSYIIGVDEMRLLITEGPVLHIGKFISLLIFSTVFYFVFAFLRELVCVIICPYGRLQGLMLDPHSIVVAYNYLRGEPRGKANKKDSANTAPKGDCIDCKLCVQVCPTGIDIRNGTQLECINCTACVDACDEVMLKIDKPTRLIGFNSKNGIDKNEKFKFTLRNVGYSVVLVGLLTLLVFLVASRKQIETTLNRTSGMLYQTQANGNISNLYNIEFVNKTFDSIPIELELIEPKGNIVLIEKGKIKVPKDELGKTSFFIEIEPKNITENQIKVLINVKSNGVLIEQVKSNFVAPVE